MRRAFLFPAILLTAPAQAQTFELRRPIDPPNAAPQIVDGRKAVPANWPATFIFDGVGSKPCTATAVGPRVILTAAHCLSAGASGKVKNSKVTLWCEKAPLDNYGFDIALCASSAPIPVAKSKPYESVDIGVPPASGVPVIMLGFGCTRAGGSGGVLYEGDAKVGSLVVDGRQFSSSGVAALCSGDSGGGAYTPVDTKRKIVGIASDIYDGVSRFALLAHPAIVDFVGKWQRRQVDPDTKLPVEVRICGIDGTNAYCRG